MKKNKKNYEAIYYREKIRVWMIISFSWNYNQELLEL